MGFDGLIPQPYYKMPGFSSNLFRPQEAASRGYPNSGFSSSSDGFPIAPSGGYFSSSLTNYGSPYGQKQNPSYGSDNFMPFLSSSAYSSDSYDNNYANQKGSFSFYNNDQLLRVSTFTTFSDQTFDYNPNYANSNDNFHKSNNN